MSNCCSRNSDSAATARTLPGRRSFAPVGGQVDKCTHRQNGTMQAIPCNAARCERISSRCEFAIPTCRDGRSSERVLDAIAAFIVQGGRNRRAKALNVRRKLKLRWRIDCRGSACWWCPSLPRTIYW